MRYLFLFLFIGSFTICWSQETSVFSTNSPQVKWYQINTPNFRILYPQGFEFQAQRMANTFEQIRAPEAASLGVKPKKISIVLQNQSSVSNGFVALAPRRSEFYAMPSQDNQFVGNNDWLNLLASHEYRHIVQFQNSITGFNKIVHTLFGQQFLAGLSFAAVPNWFWEGDAVATETAFTHAGRGRIPSFDLVFRTNLLEGRKFNYHKQYLRSYKHNIPNHYVLGYEMVSYLRKKTGNAHIWGDITHRAWSVPFIPFTFSSAIKKETGLYVRDLYNEMAASLKTQWINELSQLTLTPFEKVNIRESDTYTDYKYPQPLEDGSVLVQKSGIGNIEELIALQGGREIKSYVQGQVNATGMLSAANSRVVWNEFRYDPRWQIKTYSVLKGYDFGNKSSHIISSHTRYASAALSPDGYSVATVETGTDYKTQLIVVDYFSGKKLKEFANPDNDFISMPRFAADGKSIVALKTNAKGKSIVKYDSAGVVSELTTPSDENIGYPVPYKNYIFYNSPYSGIDNIYALNMDNGNRYQVTCSKYGAYYPAVSLNGSEIYYNEQTGNGLDVVKIAFDTTKWKPLADVAKPLSNNFQHLVEQEGMPGLLDNVPNQQYETKRYHRASGMINPHSWGPYFINSLTDIQLGISSQDILSTTSINAGYNYDATEKVGAWKATASYQGFFPIIDFSVSKGNRSVNEGTFPVTIVKGQDTTYSSFNNVKISWTEQKTQVALRIPLNTTNSKYFSNVTFGNSVGITNVSGFSNSFNSARYIPSLIRNDTVKFVRTLLSYQGNGQLTFNQFSFSAYRLLKTSRRDIYSKVGQYIEVNSINSIGGDYTGNLFSFYSRLFFPGFAKHHSINGYWAYQSSQIDNNPVGKDGKISNYLFSNQIPTPRGQSISRFRDVYSMSINYTFPLWYPDIAIGPLVNFQRVRANLFLDYAFGKTNAISRNYTSLGGELKVDLNIMRFLPQFNVGVRFSQAIESNTPSFEFLVGNIGF